MKLRLFTLALLLCILTVATHISAVESSAPVEPAATGATPCVQAESSDELNSMAYVARNGKTYTFDDIESITITNEGPSNCPIKAATATYVFYQKGEDNVSAEDLGIDPNVIYSYDIETGETTSYYLESDVSDTVEDDDEPSLLDYISDINFE